jgi:hypothetical protein
MRILRWLAGLWLATLAWSTPASAEWIEARTDHFVLVTDGKEAEVRDFAVRLERFDAALRRLYGIADNADLHSRPVTIYALDPDLFLRVCGCPGTLGYYARPLAGPRIIGISDPKADRKLKLGDLHSLALMLHEYSHHFMLTNFPAAYPYWYVEGFAEFNANVDFADDGSVILGYPANYRGAALFGGSNLPLRRLIAPEEYGYGENINLTYGRAWLLTHYLMLRPQRAGQLDRYLAGLRAGKTSLVAAREAFGDFDALDRELDVYMKQELAPPLRIPPAAKVPDVALRRLGTGEAAVLPHWLTMKDGIAKGYRKRFALKAERAARDHPDEVAVQVMGAETSFMADRFGEADAQADRALELDPKSERALLIKGRVASRHALEAGERGAASGWAAGRDWFVRANRANPESVEAFYRYFGSFAWSGQAIPASATQGLMRAAVLGPESREVAVELALQLLRQGDGAGARTLLIPLASAPHRPRDDNIAQSIIKLIDDGKRDEAIAALATLEAKVRGDG